MTRPGLSVTFVLILVNVLLDLFDMFLTPSTHAVTRYLAMHSETIFNPLYWYEFLTYGFVHANFYHIFGNMFCLFFFLFRLFMSFCLFFYFFLNDLLYLIFKEIYFYLYIEIHIKIYNKCLSLY